MGLSVTRERIASLHPGETSSFSVRPRSWGGTEVEISLPLRLDVYKRQAMELLISRLEKVRNNAEFLATMNSL